MKAPARCFASARLQAKKQLRRYIAKPTGESQMRSLRSRKARNKADSSSNAPICFAFMLPLSSLTLLVHLASAVGSSQRKRKQQRGQHAHLQATAACVRLPNDNHQ